ncbi:unnamed protein product [Urochloa humidicola]
MAMVVAASAAADSPSRPRMVGPCRGSEGELAVGRALAAAGAHLLPPQWSDRYPWQLSAPIHFLCSKKGWSQGKHK